MRDLDLFQLALGVHAEIRRALPRVSDRATRLHLEDAQVRIARILDPRD